MWAILFWSQYYNMHVVVHVADDWKLMYARLSMFWCVMDYMCVAQLDNLDIRQFGLRKEKKSV